MKIRQHRRRTCVMGCLPAEKKKPPVKNEILQKFISRQKCNRNDIVKLTYMRFKIKLFPQREGSIFNVLKNPQILIERKYGQLKSI